MPEGLYVGDVAPVAVTLVVQSGGPPSDLDLSTVSAATIQALRPDGVEVTWMAALSAQSSKSLTLSYALQSLDLPIAGEWLVFALMTVPSGTRRSVTSRMSVFNRFDRR